MAQASAAAALVQRRRAPGLGKLAVLVTMRHSSLASASKRERSAAQNACQASEAEGAEYDGRREGVSPPFEGRNMFHDEADIIIRSGNGGAGCISFRREKYVPEGGPDGGDGGKGGDVIAVANPHLSTLTVFTRKRTWKARPGQQGGSRNCAGLSGEDLILELPCGTVIRHAETDEILVDLCEAGQRVVLAAGGKGGGGNSRYKSSTNRVPRKAGPGVQGVSMPLRLQLKLIADVGFIGFPNAGKSTLLTRLSAARPKVADYPFTTLRPQLGVIERSDRQVVLADIPGLIEGAAEGAGLGHQFLRHVERCRMLLHLVEVGDGVVEEISERVATIEQELAKYSPVLARREQWLVLSKIDLVPDAVSLVQRLGEHLNRPVLAISAATGAGVNELENSLLANLQALDEDI
jgi:GTPase